MMHQHRYRKIKTPATGAIPRSSIDKVPVPAYMPLSLIDFLITCTIHNRECFLGKPYSSTGFTLYKNCAEILRWSILHSAIFLKARSALFGTASTELSA